LGAIQLSHKLGAWRIKLAEFIEIEDVIVSNNNYS